MPVKLPNSVRLNHKTTKNITVILKQKERRLFTYLLSSHVALVNNS